MNLLLSLAVVFALFAYCAAFDINAHIDADGLRRSLAKHVSSRRETERVFDRLLTETSAQGHGLSQRRRLAQMGSDLCFWDDTDRTCGIGINAVVYFLNSADNDVAAYFSHFIGCARLRDEDSCGDNACSWCVLAQGIGCSIPHEEFRELHSARCLREVDHIIDVRAGNLECMPRATELSCATSERCVWSGDSCGFDRWKYFHGIQSNGSFPEGFFEVLGTRYRQLLNDIRTAIGNGEILEFSDLLTWTPPGYICPHGVEQVVCDYVEAFLPFLIARTYCPLEYDEVFEIPDCDRDPICVAGTSGDSFCEANDVSTLISVQQGEIVFANSIEDRESRAYMLQNAHCGVINRQADCDDEEHCVWLDENDGCTVTEKWLSDEIGRLVKNTDDPVCAFFALDSLSGCVDEDDPETCIEDPMCIYSESSESCVVGTLGQIRYALDVSGLLDDYDRAEAACEEARNELQCYAVELPPRSSSPSPPADPSMSSIESPSPPGSEEAMESLSADELDELVSGYYVGEDVEDEPTSSPSPTNTTTQQTSPSTSTGSVFSSFFGK